MKENIRNDWRRYRFKLKLVVLKNRVAVEELWELIITYMIYYYEALLCLKLEGKITFPTYCRVGTRWTGRVHIFKYTHDILVNVILCRIGYDRIGPISRSVSIRLVSCLRQLHTTVSIYVWTEEICDTLWVQYFLFVHKLQVYLIHRSNSDKLLSFRLNCRNGTNIKLISNICCITMRSSRIGQGRYSYKCIRKHYYF